MNDAPRSPLHALNEELGARFTEFSGWTMPVQYEGALAEHEAVRSGCGLFDVSHLGRFAFSGPGATDTLQAMLCNDVSKVGAGRCQYTMLLNHDGGVIDDIILWRLDDDSWVVLPNAGNHHRVMAAIIAAAPDTVAAEDTRETTALVAVQGPGSPEILGDVIGGAPDRYTIAEFEFAGSRILAAGTGYTGERGAELVVDQAVATDLVRSLVAAGAVPCGLGARDSLRLEMGYPLWGQDLDETTTPLEAGLGWVVGWESEFVGKEALSAQRRGGVTRRLTGFTTESRRPPRHGYALRAGSSTGVVTSGGYSPGLEVGIGMGYLTPPVEATAAEVEMRGTWSPATLVDPPFVGS